MLIERPPPGSHRSWIILKIWQGGGGGWGVKDWIEWRPVNWGNFPNLKVSNCVSKVDNFCKFLTILAISNGRGTGISQQSRLPFYDDNGNAKKRKCFNSLKKFNPTEAGGHFNTGSWISSHLFSSQPLFAAAQTVIQVFVKWKCLCHGHLS